MDETRNERHQRTQEPGGRRRKPPEDRPVDRSPGDQATRAERRTAAEGPKSSEEIERDIAQTRREIGETVGEIQRRMRPRRLRRRASRAVRDTVRNSAQQAGNQMIDTIKENPIPTVIAGLSVGWLAAQGAKSSRRRSSDGRRPDSLYEENYRRARARGYAGGPDHTAEGGRGEAGSRSAGDRASEAAEQAEETARQYGEQARETTQRFSHQTQETARQYRQQAQETAGQYGTQARETAGRYGQRTRETARQTAGQLEHALKENPLAVGVATLAAGAFAGLMFPSTRKEDKFMGERRDQVMRKAQSAAQETAERARDVAEKTTETAQETARKEARRQQEKSGGSEADQS